MNYYHRIFQEIPFPIPDFSANSNNQVSFQIGIESELEFSRNFRISRPTSAANAFAAEVGRICLKLEEKSKEDGESNLDTNWILDFADKSGLSKATAHNWWAAFTKAANLSITPKQATAEVGRLILKLQENSQNNEILNENKTANENWIGEMGKSSGTPTQTLYRWWDSFTKSANLSITPKQATAEVGRILEKLSENGNSDHYGNFPNGKGVLWIDELSKNAGMERRTVQNWWSSFTKSAGLSITPKQATDENRQAFFCVAG